MWNAYSVFSHHWPFQNSLTSSACFNQGEMGTLHSPLLFPEAGCTWHNLSDSWLRLVVNTWWQLANIKKGGKKVEWRVFTKCAVRFIFQLVSSWLLGGTFQWCKDYVIALVPWLTCAQKQKMDISLEFLSHLPVSSRMNYVMDGQVMSVLLYLLTTGSTGSCSFNVWTTFGHKQNKLASNVHLLIMLTKIY